MLKFTKVLVIIAIVFAVAALALSCYIFYLAKNQSLTANNQPALSAEVRPELNNKYFASLELTKKVYSPAEATQVAWQLKKDLPAETLFILKVLNTKRDIFISETEPLALQKYQGSSFGNPGKAGDYELWIYLAETDNNQALVAALPFSISK